MVGQGRLSKNGAIIDQWPVSKEKPTSSTYDAKPSHCENPRRQAPVTGRSAERTRTSTIRQTVASAGAKASAFSTPNIFSTRTPWRRIRSGFWLYAGMRRRRSSSSVRSGMIGATPFRSRNSAVERMSCESGYGTESCAAQEPSERHRIGRGELNEFEAVRAQGILLLSQIDNRPECRNADRAFGRGERSFGGSRRRGLDFRPCNWCSPREEAARPRRTRTSQRGGTFRQATSRSGR
jgi:hypothetical protein